jgi:P27 family predicted phage terminase small subunit
MRGRKPTPTALKLVKGNPGRRPLPKKEPKVALVMPTPPAHLTPEVAVHFGWLVGEALRLGILGQPDVQALATLAGLMQDEAELVEIVREAGRVYETENKDGVVMHRPHPAVAQLSDVRRLKLSYLAEFGFTPAARTRVQSATDGANQDPAEAFF